MIGCVVGVSGQAGDLAGDEPSVSSDDDPEESEEDVEIPVREEEEDAPPATTPVTTETLSIGSGSRQGRLEEVSEQYLAALNPVNLRPLPMLF